jgi:hypothetical protein
LIFPIPAGVVQPRPFLWRSLVERGALRAEGNMNIKQVPEASRALPDRSDHGPLAGELMDLYVAMIIVIPVAFFLKSLWP